MYTLVGQMSTSVGQMHTSVGRMHTTNSDKCFLQHSDKCMLQNSEKCMRPEKPNIQGGRLFEDGLQFKEIRYVYPLKSNLHG